MRVCVCVCVHECVCVRVCACVWQREMTIPQGKYVNLTTFPWTNAISQIHAMGLPLQLGYKAS